MPSPKARRHAALKASHCTNTVSSSEFGAVRRQGVYREFDVQGNQTVGFEEMLALGKARRLGQKGGEWTVEMNQRIMDLLNVTSLTLTDSGSSWRLTDFGTGGTPKRLSDDAPLCAVLQWRLTR
jgi:hypothetical protein